MMYENVYNLQLYICIKKLHKKYNCIKKFEEYIDKAITTKDTFLPERKFLICRWLEFEKFIPFYIKNIKSPIISVIYFDHKRSAKKCKLSLYILRCTLNSF